MRCMQVGFIGLGTWARNCRELRLVQLRGHSTAASRGICQLVPSLDVDAHHK